MGDKSDKKYTKLMDVLEIIHTENVVIMTAIVRLMICEDQAERILNETTKKWIEAFKDIRTHW